MRKSSIMLQVFLIATSLFFYSCEGIKQKIYTPKEFLNHTVIKQESYIKDSVQIIRQLQVSLINHEDFFNNKAYFDSTQLIIDTILYSPDFNRLAVFVMVKNPTYRQLVPDRNYDWYYEATCYLGIRQKDSISLNWIGPSFTNSYNKTELSNIMRDSYFTNFATKDTVGLYTYKYNLNDIRFWDSNIWEEVQNKRLKKQEFENEKKNHPENIYEPKKQQ